MLLRGLTKRGRHGLCRDSAHEAGKAPTSYISVARARRPPRGYSESPVFSPGERNFVGERPLSENARAQGDHRVVARSVQGALETDRARRRRHSRGTCARRWADAEIDERAPTGGRANRLPPRTFLVFCSMASTVTSSIQGELISKPSAPERPTLCVEKPKKKGNHQKERLQPESLRVFVLDVYAPNTLDQVPLQPLIRRRLAHDPRAAPAPAQVGLGAGLVPLGAVRLDLGNVERLDRFGSICETGFGGHGGRGLGGLATVLDEHAARDGAGSVEKGRTPTRSERARLRVRISGSETAPKRWRE